EGLAGDALVGEPAHDLDLGGAVLAHRLHVAEQDVCAVLLGVGQLGPEALGLLLVLGEEPVRAHEAPASSASRRSSARAASKSRWPPLMTVPSHLTAIASSPPRSGSARAGSARTTRPPVAGRRQGVEEGPHRPAAVSVLDPPHHVLEVLLAVVG